MGKTEIELSRLGFGGAPIGDLFEKVPQNQAHATLQAAWKAGIRYFDTSPFYGYGKSEQRLGYFLREKPRDEFVISTKVGRVFKAARNLKTFEVSTDVSKKLANQISDEFVKISESGISNIEAIQELKTYGYSGFLIGENFMKTANPGEACQGFIQQLSGR